jgi:hypothetical protein
VFSVQCSVFRVQGVGLSTWDLGPKVQCSVFSDQGVGFRVQGSGFSVQGSGFRVYSAQGFRLWLQDSGLGDLDLGSKVQGVQYSGSTGFHASKVDGARQTVRH